MITDQIVNDGWLTQSLNPFSFDLLIQQIVFYTVTATILIGCVCICTLLIRKVVKSFKTAK